MKKNVEKYLNRHGQDGKIIYKDENINNQDVKIILKSDFRNMNNEKAKEYNSFGISGKTFIKAYSEYKDVVPQRADCIEVNDEKYYINSCDRIFLGKITMCLEYKLSKEE